MGVTVYVLSPFQYERQVIGDAQSNLLCEITRICSNDDLFVFEDVYRLIIKIKMT